MNCQNGGKEIEENQKFCTNCGAKVSNVEDTKEETSQKINKMKNIIKLKPFIISSVFALIVFVCILSTVDFNNIKKEISVFKSVQEFNNLKYDKEKLKRLYQEAYNSFQMHQGDKDENGNYIYAGTGSAEGYITDYINEKAPEYKKVLDTIWNYCNDTKIDNEGMTGFRNCYHDEISK